MESMEQATERARAAFEPMSAAQAELHLAGQMLVRAMTREAGAFASGNARRIAKAMAESKDAARRVDAARARVNVEGR